MAAPWLLSAIARLTGSVILGGIAGSVTGALKDVPLGVLVGIACTGVVYVAGGWLLLWPMDAEATHRHAHQEAFNPVVEELVIVAAARSSSVAARVSAMAKARVMASVSSGSRCHRSCKWVVSRSSRCVGVPGPPVQSPATSRR